MVLFLDFNERIRVHMRSAHSIFDAYCQLDSMSSCLTFSKSKNPGAQFWDSITHWTKSHYVNQRGTRVTRFKAIVLFQRLKFNRRLGRAIMDASSGEGAGEVANAVALA